MTRLLRRVARALLGVERPSVYYLPWVVWAGLDCVLMLSAVEARFKSGHNAGSFDIRVTQYAADGRRLAEHHARLERSTDMAEVTLSSPDAGWGFVTVAGDLAYSDLYVTLSDDEAYAATHGRQEFVEQYPARGRAVLAAVGAPLAWFGRTVPAFVRYQYAYVGTESRSDLLLLNLSNVANRVRVVTLPADGGPGVLVRIPPMGSHLLNISRLVPPPAEGIRVVPLRLEGNAWFNLYVVGAVGDAECAAPLSLMHVK
jgi:hypothetical protein